MIDREIARRAWRIAWPLMVAESLDSILWIIDTFFVSLLGDTAVAAVGVGGYLGWLFFVGSTMMYMGALVLASQAIGAGRGGDAGRIIGESVTSNTVLAVPIGLIGYYAAEPMLILLNARGEVLAEAVDYFRVRALGLPVVYAYLVYDAAYRAAGLTRPVLVATGGGVIVNTILDPLLILGIGPFPAMGVAGASLASVIATMVNLAILHVNTTVLGFRVKPVKPSAWALKAARVGLPSMVERLAFVTGNVAYIGSVAGCGDKPLAAHTIGVRIESLAFLPMFSIATAAGSMVGQEVGGGRVLEARRVGWEIGKASLLFGGLTGAVLVLGSGFMPLLFTEDPEVARLSRIYLVIAGLTEPALGLEMTIAQTIRGAGNTIVPTIVNLASLYTLRVIPAYILPGYMPPGLCVLGAWSAMALDVVGRGVALSVIYRRYFTRLARRLV